MSRWLSLSRFPLQAAWSHTRRIEQTFSFLSFSRGHMKRQRALLVRSEMLPDGERNREGTGIAAAAQSSDDAAGSDQLVTADT